MAEANTMRAFARLLSYPDEHTIEAAELLYIILQSEAPDAASELSAFGTFVDGHEPWEVEEAFTRTFDVNPACALEVGWHLFGEDYTRGMFLVRMREELRKYDLTESIELPDHMTHVLAVVAAMPQDEASRFVRACVQPAVEKMRGALANQQTPYRHVVASFALVLNHVWGRGEACDGGAQSAHLDARSIPPGVDPLHALPVADVSFGCSGGCGCAEDDRELMQLAPKRPESNGQES